MNIKRLLGNFSVAVASQAVYIAVNVLASLFIPKVLGVAEFGYYQLFTFYITYTGVFHLGLNDGVYLINGGTSRNRIDKRGIKSQFFVGVSYQLFFAAILIIVALTGSFGDDRTFVIAMAAIYLVLSNAAGFFGLLFQAMNETKLYSASVALDGACFLAPLLVLLGIGCPDFRLYVILSAFSKTIVICFLLFNARDLLKAKPLHVAESWKLASKSIRIGIKLMLANIVGMLIIGSARFLADAHWDIETFSILSFALSMTMFFMTFISQASMVLFPALRQASEDESNRFFAIASDAIDLFFPAIYLVYYPAVWLLTWWLPQYQASFLLFAHLLPLCVFDAKTDMIGATFLKVHRKEAMLLKFNAAALALAIVGDLAAVYCFNSLEALVVWTVLVIIARSCFIELYLCKLLKTKRGLLPYASLAIAAYFIVATTVFPDWATITGLVACLALHVTLFRKKIGGVFSGLSDQG